MKNSSVSAVGIGCADQNQSVRARNCSFFHDLDLKLMTNAVLALMKAVLSCKGGSLPGVVLKSDKQQHDHSTTQ